MYHRAPEFHSVYVVCCQIIVLFVILGGCEVQRKKLGGLSLQNQNIVSNHLAFLAISINVVGSKLQAKRQNRKVVWVVLNLPSEAR